MIAKLILSITMTSLISTAFAVQETKQNCQGLTCFSQLNATAVDNKIFQNSTKLAWRPGHYNSRSSGSTSSESSWFISVPRTGPANPKGTIVFNPRESTFAAYDSNGNLVKSGRASGGMSWCDDVARSCRTPIGTFRVYSKGDESCISNTYPLEDGGGAPMPHCMYFNGGYAIHGSYYVPNKPASHGCIRVTPSNAEWLHKNFVRIGTVVKVQSY